MNKHDIGILTFLTGLIILSIMPLDFLLPAFSQMANEFNVSIATLSLSISLSAFIFSIAQICSGILSDYYGLNRIINIGLILCACGALACIFAASYLEFLLARLIQDIGASCFVTAQMIIRNNFNFSKGLEIRVYLVTLSGILIAISPLIGSIFFSVWSWRLSFLIYVILSMTLLVLHLGLNKRNNDKAVTANNNFQFIFFQILCDKYFIKYSLINAMAFSCHFSFIAISPYFFLSVLNYSTFEYGQIMLIYGLCYLLAGVFIRQFIANSCMENLLFWAGILVLSAGILLFLSLNFLRLSIFSVFIPILISTVGTTIMRTVSVATIVEKTSYQCTGSAVNGCLQILFGSITCGLINLLNNYWIIILIFILATSGLLCTSRWYRCQKN